MSKNKKITSETIRILYNKEKKKDNNAEQLEKN